MERKTFERLVAEALDGLPRLFLEKLDNVEVVVETMPGPEALRRAGLQHPAELLGLYQGVPQTRRTRRYGLVLPDKITIYQWPIERRCRTPEDVRRVVQRVVRHEIAHHFGISDDGLRELGAY